MLCGHPITIDGRKVPCGQCMNCRINRQRSWIGKILLEEAHSKSISSFLTLTYNEENCPQDGSLVRHDLNAYINRIRGGSLGKIRYFAVGEYGTKNIRPHYHMILFGNPAEEWEQYLNQKWINQDGEPMGFTTVGDLRPGGAAYIAGYCTKKMTSKDDPRLEGKEPEFSLMSRKPPLGKAGMDHILALCTTKSGALAIAKHGDVPSTFRVQGKQYPFSPYWKSWLREQLGIAKDLPDINPWELPTKDWDREYEQAAKQDEKRYRARKRPKGKL